MQLTAENITTVTGVTLDATKANNIWIPAVIQEIQTRCNRSFMGDDAYVQPQTGTTNWVNEVPPETVDGVNKIFTLTQTPTDGKVEVYRDGQRVFQGVDYSLDVENKRIEFVEAPLPGSQIPIFVKYLPAGEVDTDAEEAEVPEFPPDLGVAACWHTVIVAQSDPASVLTAQNDSDVKAEWVGNLKVEYFGNGTEKRKEIEDTWSQVLTRYRIPAICDLSQTQSQSMPTSW